MLIASYKELTVWKKSMELVKEIYRLAELFPKEETYGLKSQMERTVVSVPSQIAEGYLRKHRKEYLYFLSVSLGSSAELETQILICKSVGKFKHIDFSRAEVLLTEVMKMLYVMIEKLEEIKEEIYPFPLTLSPL
jgi:four helix bundle protein